MSFDFDSVPFGNALDMDVAFSNAIRLPISGEISLVWVSGQLAFGEDDKLVGVGDVGAQTEQCIQNIASILGHFGGDLDAVTNVLIFVKSMDGLAEIHRVRRRHFHEPYPASTLVQVANLAHPDALIEIQAQAAIRH